MKRISIISILLLNALLAFSQVTYQYDNLNRLQKVAYANGITVDYTYDELGNRTKKTVVSSSVAVTGVSLDKTALTLTAGSTEQLTATVAPGNASSNAVTWSSSNTSVATVNNGLVTGVAAGTATITVTTNEGSKTADCAVTVNPGTSLSVSPSSLNFVANGGTQTFDISSNVAWTVSSTESWATVSAALGSDNSTITVTATANSGSASRTATITVSGGNINRTVDVTQAGTPIPAPSLSVSTSSLNFAATGGAQAITVSSNVAWTVSSTESWATVSAASGSDNGTVTVTAAANSGHVSRTATVTFSGGGVTRTVNVTQAAGTVPPAVSPASVSVTPAELRLEPGGTARLSATVLPANASDQSVTWSSSNRQVAAVSSDGQVTAVSQGIAVITARTGTGNHTGACTVSVEEQSVVAQPVPPAGSRGSIEVSLNVPVNEVFSISFLLTLPAGFTLDESATELVSELLDSHQLAISPAGTGNWLLQINPKASLRNAGETVYQQVVRIAYTMDASVAAGNYEASLRNVYLRTGLNGTAVQQEEIKVPITLAYNVGNAAVDAGNIRYASGILTVNTPVAEQITVYSISGSVMYQAQKAAGEATFDLHSLPKGVFIARGSSGWTRKAVISD